MAFPLIQSARPLISSRIAQRLQSVEEDPYNYTIQYPIRREHFQDSFSVRPIASFNSSTIDENNNVSSSSSSSSSSSKQVRFQERRALRQQSFSTPQLLSRTGHALPLDHESLPSLYVHVPFCAAKCFYCNFAVDTRSSAGLHEAYVEALCKELRSELLESLLGNRIVGIDIGGGTPSILSVPLLERLLGALSKWRAACVSPHPLSMESTPAVAAEDSDRLRMLAASGVDRISIGLQSTNEETLKALNRSHQIELGEKAVANIHRAGFARSSADLIFGLPGQTAQHWGEDVRRVAEYDLDTITTYDCIYKGRGRAFRTRLNTLEAARPSWEIYGELYDIAYDHLTKAGYHAPYGSVNFSRHPGETGTSAYFEHRLLDGGSYIGVGNYASSLLNSESLWWFAPYSVDEWLDRHQQCAYLSVGDAYALPRSEHMAKYILASLSFGLIDPSRFAALFHSSVSAVFQEELSFALQNRLLVWDEAASHYLIPRSQFRNMPILRSLFVTDHFFNWKSQQQD